MNAKKFVKKIVSVGAASGLMVGATMMGAVAASTQADLQDLPAPFVENGVDDFQIVLGQGAAVGDVIGAIDISNSFQAASVTETAVEVSGTSSATVSDGYQLEGTNGGDYLVFGEAATESIDDNDLPDLLAEQTVKDKDGDDGSSALSSAVEEESDYDTDIHIGAFTVNYGTPDELDDPILFLDIGDGISTFTYTVEVDLEDSIDFTAMDDNELLTIAGRPFTIGESGTDDDTLSLFGSDSTTFVQLNQPQTVVIDGQSVELEVVGGNSDANNGDGTIVLSVNGERETLEEGETETFSGDIEIFVRDLFVTNIPTLDASATLFVGSEEIDLEDDSEIDINKDPLDGYEFTLPATATGFNDTDGFNFTLTAARLDDETLSYLEIGESMPDPFFGTFELIFAGSSLDLMDDRKIPYSLDASNNEIDVTFTNDDGEELTWTAFEHDDTTITPYVDNSEVFSIGNTSLRDNDVFLGQDSDTTSLFKVLDIDLPTSSNPKVKIENLGTGNSKEYSVDGSTQTIDDSQYSLAAYTNLDGSVNITGGPTQSWFLLKGGANVTVSYNGTSKVVEGINFTEDSSDYDDVTTIGSANVSFSIDSNDDFEMSVATGGFTTSEFDNEDESGLSPFGTYFILDDDGVNFDLWTPDEDEVQYSVFIAPTGSAVTTSSTGGAFTSQTVNPVAVGAAVLDVDVNLATANKNLVVVGGPVINNVAAELLGFPTPEQISDMFAPSTAMIELFDLDNGKVAMLVAGYEAEETQAASRAVATTDSRLSGDEVALQVTSVNDFSISTVQ